MATIESYETKSGKRYRVRYRTPDRKQTDKRGFRTKRDAEAFANTVEVEKLTGTYIAPKLGQITIGELGPDWLARQSHLKPSSYRPVETSWRVHVEPKWGSKRLADVTMTSVEQWITDLGAAGKGATVVIRAYGILAAILDDAVKDRRIARNPARGVDNLPRKKKRAHIYLTHDQVQRLAENAGANGTMVLTMAYCGLRWGEAVGLRVQDVDLLRKRLTITQNAVEVGREVIVGTPKNHKQRSVPVPRFLVVELAHQCEGKTRGALVFPGADSKHMRSPRSERGWFDGAVKRAGLPRLTPHDLRHTAASLAVSAGANVKAVQKMLGHASAAMTLDVYADLFDDDLDAVANALDDARASACAG
ncbi:site-specific integrase [Rhodococcus sp. (in: high G+C Gram-positive bacteria)]|uniref:site-specific integrase n=1 Tax=Rhodococcus sp. TaxID=1831 RepID=UPI00258D616F|nr:site-specific integrase [Rhodococcus sp. (in: high G+C Gram-positive bacteria)]